MTAKRPLHIVLAIFLLASSQHVGLSGNCSAVTPGFRWVNNEDKLLLQENGRDVLVFRLQSDSPDDRFGRAQYVHPLFDTDGDVVTEDSPKDHRHHRGVFWAWHQVLLNGQPKCDPWVCKDIQWLPPDNSRPWEKTRANAHCAELTVVRDWAVPSDQGGEPERLVREAVHITVSPSQPNLRILDFDLRLRALQPGVRIGGSDDVKGYGGFSPRIRLADDVKFFSQLGQVTPRWKAAVDGGAWMDVVRTLDGKVKGVAMMVHPSHPNFPLKWILRPKHSMQNAQWPGREPVELSADKDLRLRYRLVLHVGRLSYESLESIWQDYARSEQ